MNPEDFIRKFLESKGIKVEGMGKLEDGVGFVVGSMPKDQKHVDYNTLPPDIKKKLDDLAEDTVKRMKNVFDPELGMTVGEFEKKYQDMKKQRPDLERKERIGLAMMEALTSALHEGERVEMLELFNIMTKVYLTFFKATTPPEKRGILSTSQILHIANDITMKMGEELAKLDLVEYVGDRNELR